MNLLQKTNLSPYGITTVTITERCLLLAWEQSSAGLRLLPEQALAGMLAGALLFDLAIAGKLDNNLSDLIVTDRSMTDIQLLDFAIQQLPEGELPIQIQEMTTVLAVQASRILAYGSERLQQSGFISDNTLTPSGRDLAATLRESIVALVEDCESVPAPADVMLLGLAEAGQLWPVIFTKELDESHKHRLEHLARLEFIHRAMLSAVQKFSTAEIAELAGQLSSGRYVLPCATTAGGVGVIKSALEHIYSRAGVLRGTQALAQVNQNNGYDCPGCAWGHPENRRERFEFCENGAKSIAAEVCTRMLDQQFFEYCTISELSHSSDYELEQLGRIARPMLRRPGATGFTPVDWEEAYRLIKQHTDRLSSPDEAVFYVSGKSGNEAAFLLQLLARKFGTNNLAGSANLCHEASGIALTQTIGSGKSTVSNHELEQADLILLFGHNPGSNHPRMLLNLQQAVRNGARLVAINPLPEAGLMGFANPREAAGLLGMGTGFGTIHLPVRINGDQALVRALILAVMELEEQNPGKVLDHMFIQQHTSGFDQFVLSIRQEKMDRLSGICGIPEEQIREIARLFACSAKVTAAWCLGVTQHVNGVSTLREIVNLMLMRGMIGRPGAGLCPVRGHSNVQGHRTVGVGTRMPAQFLDALGETFGFQPPRTEGLDAMSAIDSMHHGRIRIMFSLGGNLLAAAPDTIHTTKAMQRCSLVVNIATKLNRQHLLAGETALILPCLGRSEKDMHNGDLRWITTEDTTGAVRASRGCVEPLSSQMRSETQIVSELATAILGHSSGIPWEELGADYNMIRTCMAHVIPGFDQLSDPEKKNSSVQLPNPARHGKFCTSDGKAHFTTQPLGFTEPAPGQFVLTTLRSHDQFNTSVFGLEDRYRGVHGTRQILMMHPEDIREHGFSVNQIVELDSSASPSPLEIRRFRLHPYALPRGCVAAYFPEANPLIPSDRRDPESNTPAFKSTPVTISPASVSLV